MSCCLHKIIETHQEKKLKIITDLVDYKQDIDRFMLLVKENAICFDIGKENEIVKFKIIADILILPFSVCYFEIKAEENNYGYLCIQDGNKISGYVVSLAHIGVIFYFSIDKQTIDEGITIHNGNTDFENKLAFSLLDRLCKYISAINCINIKTVETKPDSKLQKARIKRGKLPIYSFHTLYLNLGKESSSSAHGGTHASPRLHLRRGHPREFSPGKWTWVQPCVVGNKALGVVHKDYAAKYPV